MALDKDECIICLDPLDEGMCYRLGCTHILHKTCFEHYFERHFDMENNTIRCPVCQQALELQRIESLQLNIPNFISAGCCLLLSVLILTNMVYIATNYWF